MSHEGARHTASPMFLSPALRLCCLQENIYWCLALWCSVLTLTPPCVLRQLWGKDGEGKENEGGRPREKLRGGRIVEGRENEGMRPRQGLRDGRMVKGRENEGGRPRQSKKRKDVGWILGEWGRKAKTEAERRKKPPQQLAGGKGKAVRIKKSRRKELNRASENTSQISSRQKEKEKQ